MAVADIIPSFEREKRKCHNYEENVRILCIMACWKALCISNIPKSIYGTQSPLEVKVSLN
jgi:hypothetical protein